MYTFLKKLLEGIPDLAPVETQHGRKARVFPVAELVEETESPFAITDSTRCEPFKTLLGETVYTDEDFSVIFEADVLDDAIRLCSTAETELDLCRGKRTADGKQIITATYSRQERDHMDSATGLMCRVLHISFRWMKCPE